MNGLMLVIKKVKKLFWKTRRVFCFIDLSQWPLPQSQIHQYAREQYRALHYSIDMDSDSSSSWASSHKDSSSENELVFDEMIGTETGDEDEDPGADFSVPI